jgi:hypothetical protein
MMTGGSGGAARPAACRPQRSGLGWRAASRPSRPGATRQVRTDNLDLVLSQITAEECNDAADELARYLDAGLMTTRELLAAFLNDLNNECLTRWGPRGESGDAGRLPVSPP